MNNLNESRQCPDQESNHAPYMSETFSSSHLSRFTEFQLKFMTQSVWLLRNTPIWGALGKLYRQWNRKSITSSSSYHFL